MLALLGSPWVWPGSASPRQSAGDPFRVISAYGVAGHWRFGVSSIELVRSYLSDVYRALPMRIAAVRVCRPATVGVSIAIRADDARIVCGRSGGTVIRHFRPD